MERDLRAIMLRWRAASALRNWRGQPPAQRERLLGDLEDMQREASIAGTDADAAVLAAAVAVLDCVSADGALATWDEATADMEWLLEQVESLRRRLRLST